MSLLSLLNQSVVVKFTGAAQPQYDPAVGYVFRLTSVDGMGFLQLQDLRLGVDAEHETFSEPYWINKDLVREIHDYASANGKDALKFTGHAAQPAAKPAPSSSTSGSRETSLKMPKGKPAKFKSTLL